MRDRLLAASFAVFYATAAFGGAAISVTTLSDGVVNDGNCTLREAIIAANTNAAVDACPAGQATEDVITLTTGTYNLTVDGFDEAALTGDLDILGDVQVVGAGSANTIISANSIVNRIFHVLSGTVRIDALQVTGGRQGTGGGINVATGATLTLNNVRLTSNTARMSGSGRARGGALYVAGTATLNNASVDNNRAVVGASGSALGGGIHNNGGTLTLNNSTVTGNSAQSGAFATSQGGGIYTTGGTTTLNSTTPSGNTVVTGARGTTAGQNTFP